MKNFRIKNSFSIVPKVGFFTTSLLLTAVSAIYIYSPVERTNAAQITVSGNEGYESISLSTNDMVNIDIVPTASQDVYSSTNTLTISNSCSHGATVSMTTSSSSNKLTRIGSDALTKDINPTTGSNLVDSSWGYSVNNGTNYYAVPNISGTPANIYNSSQAAYGDVVNVKYGVKADYNLPSGTYVNDVIYTISVNPACLAYQINWNYSGGAAESGVDYPATLQFGDTIDLTAFAPERAGFDFVGWSNGSSTFTGTETNANINPYNNTQITMTAQWEEIPTLSRISSMQDMTTRVCDYSAANETATIEDARDHNTYTIKKLADGKCWMTQNLRIIDKIITSADSNLPSGESWTVPASSSNGFDSYNTNNAYINSNYGGYYTVYTATAGWGTNTVSSGDSPKSICPKGWKMPSIDDYVALTNKYNSVSALMGDPGFVLSGAIHHSALGSTGTAAGYWSSTTYSTTQNRGFYISNSEYLTGDSANYEKYVGRAVRCLAE